MTCPPEEATPAHCGTKRKQPDVDSALTAILADAHVIATQYPHSAVSGDQSADEASERQRRHNVAEALDCAGALADAITARTVVRNAFQGDAELALACMRRRPAGCGPWLVEVAKDAERSTPSSSAAQQARELLAQCWAAKRGKALLHDVFEAYQLNDDQLARLLEQLPGHFSKLRAAFQTFAVKHKLDCGALRAAAEFAAHGWDAQSAQVSPSQRGRGSYPVRDLHEALCLVAAGAGLRSIDAAAAAADTLWRICAHNIEEDSEELWRETLRIWDGSLVMASWKDFCELQFKLYDTIDLDAWDPRVYAILDDPALRHNAVQRVGALAALAAHPEWWADCTARAYDGEAFITLEQLALGAPGLTVAGEPAAAVDLSAAFADKRHRQGSRRP